MLRFLGGRYGFFANLDWVPRVPVLQSKTVFASFFPHSATHPHAESAGGNGDGDAVWTFINRDRENDATGAQIELSVTPQLSVEPYDYFDCYHGNKLQPTPATAATTITLSFPIEAGGIGCLLRLGKQSATINRTTLAAFLDTMTKLTAGKPLRSFSREWNALQQKLLPHNKTSKSATAAKVGVADSMPPEGMVLVPPGVFNFLLKGVGHEGSAQVQFPWESLPSNTHVKTINVTGAYGKGLYVDQFPVTCSQYAVYLRASGYIPSDPYNWLKNWNHTLAVTDPAQHELPAAVGSSNGSTSRRTWSEALPVNAAVREGGGSRIPAPVTGFANKPVTYVSFAEAERYCKFFGKRLPEAWEFQYFATGGRRNYSFPWGANDDVSRYPQPGMVYLPNGTIINHNHFEDTIPGPADVHLFAHNGSSPFNVSDLMGNIWQYTSHFEDEHTSGVITQGSCNYDRDSYAPYYFTRAKTLQEHNKWFLFDDSWERCGTIGFRCVSDI
jgi:formylglycine-generating enzyme required for sulfatase activity